MMNRRVQLRRSKGWRKPEGTVVVARPTRWGNPYVLHGEEFVHPDGRSWRVADGGARALAVELYREDLLHGRLGFGVERVRAELAGRDLACWCPLDQPCHADVLLAVANPDAPAWDIQAR
jgi:hypothetical protein